MKSLSKMPERKFFDEPFEQKGYVSFHKPDIQHPVLQVQQVAKPLTEKLSISQEVNRDIRDRAKAQEALVLAEVLGPPVSKRPHRMR